jgi:DNA-binding transcriptional regulator YhcF (GntR family)
VPISENDPRPIYEQIADELRQAIASGQYQPGDRLPSITALTEQHQVAPMTVRKALRLLQDQHLAVASQGRGVYVLPPQPAPEPAPDLLTAVQDSLHATRDLLAQLNQRLDRYEEAQRQGPGNDTQVEQDKDAGRDTGVERDDEPAALSVDDKLDQAMEDLRAASAALDEAAPPGIDPYYDPGPEPDRGPDLGL